MYMSDDVTTFGGNLSNSFFYLLYLRGLLQSQDVKIGVAT